ncbi:hypothetical protein C0584_01940 [Candidatus Parcubacteria bacterium]|nr:MAG: hypothetical protein C0584_01940 [Candidatus Parcubacteria bacterium]
MKKNKYIQFLLILLSAQVLTACSSDAPSQNQEETIDTSNNQNEDSPLVTSTAVSEEKITINHKCIGCNRCVMVDREHFSYQPGSRIPAVKSQENTDSSKLRMAIRHCPTSAIELS